MSKNKYKASAPKGNTTTSSRPRVTQNPSGQGVNNELIKLSGSKINVLNLES
jgi:hypothetical protein